MESSVTRLTTPTFVSSLDYGWSVGYITATLPTSTFKNHGSGSGSSVNDGIPKDSYHDEPLTLRLPGTDALIAIILQKGSGCLLFKKDLSRANRQLRIASRNFHLLGVQHHGCIYFDVAPPFGLRSAAMMCQRTTSAVSHMFSKLGYQCTNYIDDFGGAESPSKATMAFETLEELFSILGLESSPEKDCFELAGHHIQGTSNSLADHLSRWHLSPGHKAHFEALTADIPTVHVPYATELFNFDVRI